MEIAELKKLYLEESKHSNYQILSKRLSQLISSDEIKIKSRYEQERLRYILKNVYVKYQKILDIGGNTGFFTFELIDNGAEKVHYYEGNKTHARFVSGAANLLNVEDKIEVTDKYFSFKSKLNRKYDLVLLLNILHHIGDDYGDQKLSMEKAKEDILEQLNFMAEMAETIAFQIGFNWKGNKELNLFENGTKEEMIKFIRDGVKNHWEVSKVGIAECRNGLIEYCDLNEVNINRWDHIGEFLNRPIFIMKSLKK